jgi:hypothetical protein
MDIAAIAKAAGLTVLLDGQIGLQKYESVSGSLAALHRFGDAYSAAKRADEVAALEQPKTGNSDHDLD